MSVDFNFLMLSAMYENGGNVTHRLLDGHPQMFVYPFESQIGTRLVHDSLSSTFPVKYRWPVFDLEASAYQDYKAIIDEEGKVRSRTPHVSKFRHMPFDFSDDERCEIYQRLVGQSGRSRGNNVAAFFKATFEAWKDYKRTGEQSWYVGYSPIIVVDAGQILADLPGAHVLQVVRNPWSAYADTKKRPVPMSLAGYTLAWNLNQYYALLNQKKYPDRVHVLRTEDILADPQATLGALCEKLGLKAADSLATPTWNGNELEEVYPWGTIRQATSAANLATAKELSKKEMQEVAARTWQYHDAFAYKELMQELGI